MIEIRLFDSPLDVQHCIEFASSPDAGAVDVFIGSVRSLTKGRRVLRLEYEAYAPMALREMEKIARQCCERFEVKKIAMHHRTGLLLIGDAAVVIAVSAAHRAASFEACRYAIEALKETVPIWKKEFFEDGEVWVAAHP